MAAPSLRPLASAASPLGRTTRNEGHRRTLAGAAILAAGASARTSASTLLPCTPGTLLSRALESAALSASALLSRALASGALSAGALLS